MPQSARSNLDPEFWDRLRDALTTYMKAAGLNQRKLAFKLGIDPTTLNNFLNRQSKSLGGLAVALACTFVDLVCDGTNIGKLVQDDDAEPIAELQEEQLVLVFDGSFEFKGDSEHPTLVVRKRPALRAAVRLA